jgi:hypothetical protein
MELFMIVLEQFMIILERSRHFQYLIETNF